MFNYWFVKLAEALEEESKECRKRGGVILQKRDAEIDAGDSCNMLIHNRDCDAELRMASVCDMLARVVRGIAKE